MVTVNKQAVLNCSSCILRKWQKSDLKSLVENASNWNIWINLKDTFPFPYTPEAALKWLKFTEMQPANTNFAIVVKDKAIGGIGVTFFDDLNRYSAEIGFWIGENYWGRGIATEAVKIFTAFIFENFGINRIFARVFDWNLSSAKVLEKNGFKIEGRLRKNVYKDGLFTDELIFGLLKDEFKP